MIRLVHYLSAIAIALTVAVVLLITGTLVTSCFVAMVAVLIWGVILDGASSLRPSTKEKGEREERADVEEPE